MNFKDNENAIRKAIAIFNMRNNSNNLLVDDIIGYIKELDELDKIEKEKTGLPKYYDRKKNFYKVMFNRMADNFISSANYNIKNEGMNYPVKYFSELNSLFSSITEILYEDEKVFADERYTEDNENEYNKLKNDLVDSLNGKLLEKGIDGYRDYKNKLIESKTFTNSKSRDRLFTSGGKLARYKQMLTVEKKPALIEAALDLRAMEEKHNSQNSFMRFISFREKKAMKIARENLKAALISNDENLDNEINNLIGESKISKSFKYLKDENASKKYNFNYLENMIKTKNAIDPLSKDSYEYFSKQKANDTLAVVILKQSYIKYQMDHHEDKNIDSYDKYRNEYVDKHLKDCSYPNGKDIIKDYFSVYELNDNKLPSNTEKENFEVDDLNDNYENDLENTEELENEKVIENDEFEIEESKK